MTLETTEQGHSHIDVPDPSMAAIVINEIDDERTGQGLDPAHARIESYENFWQCECGEQRGTEATPDTGR